MNNDPNLIKLGDLIEDLASGFQGIATGRMIHLNGCMQIGITPKVAKAGDNVPDTQYIDFQRLKVVKAGVLKSQPLMKHNIELGNQIQDLVSGVKGMATMFYERLSGTVSVGITPKAKKGATTLPETYYLTVDQIKIIGKGIAEPIKKVNAETKKTPGGPIMKASTFKSR